ncbi:MAG: hypothetical protein ACOVO0_05145, partial [Burkholderiaceae bacterium]
MAMSAEPLSGSSPLLDVLPQASATGAGGVGHFRADLADGMVPLLGSLADRVGVSVESVAMAAWLVALDRLRGDATVDLGGARFTVPSEESCADWLLRLKAEARSQSATSGTSCELDWAMSQQQLALRHEECLLCAAFDVQAMAWICVARTPPLSCESVQT